MKISLPKRFATLLAVVGLGSTAALPTSAQDTLQVPLDPGLAWNDVSAVRLDVEFPGDGYHASWLLHRCECGDLLIESELNLPGDVEKGELLLVGQRAVLERGFRSKELESQMSWDAPALMMQLTAYLLQRALPDGPGSVSENTVVSIREEGEGILLDSGMSSESTSSRCALRYETTPSVPSSIGPVRTPMIE